MRHLATCLLLGSALAVLAGCYTVDFDVDPNTFDCDFGSDLDSATCISVGVAHHCDTEWSPDGCTGKRCSAACGSFSAVIRNCVWSGVTSTQECVDLVAAAGCANGRLTLTVPGTVDLPDRCSGWACTDTTCPGS